MEDTQNQEKVKNFTQYDGLWIIAKDVHVMCGEQMLYSDVMLQK